MDLEKKEINQDRINRREEKIQEAKDFEKSPWVFLIRKSRLTYLIIAFLLLFGLITIGQLPKELNPEVEIPIAFVLTPYPGASPLNVEQQVTKEIENKISNLEGIDEVSSTSYLGVSSILVKFDADEDLDEAIRNLKDKVQEVESDLPGDAEDPKVVEISLSDEAIFIATLSSDYYDIADLKKYAENLKDKLEGIAFVSEVKIIGGKDKTINIEVDQNLLSEKGLSISDIVNSIASNNIDFPLGSVEFSNSKYSLRVEGEFKSAQEIANLPIKYVNNKPVYFSDVAKVEDGFSDVDSMSRLSIGQEEPKESISLQLYKKTGGDITKVANEAKKIVEEGKGIDYPENVETRVTTNYAEYIEESIGTLMSNGMQTVFIILILLFVFLGFREALLAGLSVPFSFFIAFIVMAIIGESLNFLSLFALVLALGLLVDSAIVIVEGMYKLVGIYKISGYQAAILTIKNYAAPLLSGMLTTIAVFFPLMFVKGILGEFLKTIPVVVNATLIAALFVSLSIIPAVGSLVFKPRKKKKNGLFHEENGKHKMLFQKLKKLISTKPREERKASVFFEKISQKYYEILPKIIGDKKSRKKLIWGIVGLFALSIALPISGFLKIKSFGENDAEYFSISIEMPEGSLIEDTNKVASRVEKILLQEDEIVDFLTSVGAVSGSSASSSDGQENKAFIKVNLTEKEEREITSYDFIANLRKKVAKEVTEAEIEFLEEESGPPTGEPIELRVVGDDLEILEELAEDIKKKLAEIPTVIEEKTSVKFSSGEFVFVPNKDIFVRENLSVLQIASQLRNGISGNDNSEITKEGDDINIAIKYDEDKLTSYNEIGEILINTPSGKKYALSELGEINLKASLAEINHREKERVVSITANTDGGNPTEITQELQKRLQNFSLPQGYRIDYGGEQEELGEIFLDMAFKMIIGIILILFILTVQFNSYKQVLIILITIPLAITGVFIGMAIARLTIDIPAFIGIVSLAGIVVNNAIVLVDQINKELKGGKELMEAVRHSGRSRLRPILLTSITTVFGLLPLSITQPDWRNMGFSIIFGLTFATFFSLIVVPSIFMSFYSKDKS